MVHTDTPCYSYHDESSHFVHLSSSIAAQKAVAGRPSACRAQRSMKRVAAQGLAPGLVVAHRPLLVSTRTRPANPRRHRCDCWTRGPTAEAPTPSGSMHRDAPAVKARERPRQPLRELEKICIQGVHGPDLADFAKGKILILLFCSGGVHKAVLRSLFRSTILIDLSPGLPANA